MGRTPLSSHSRTIVKIPNRKQVQGPVAKQGSDLTQLRRTWREMENLNFETFIRIFGEIIEDFGDFWRNFGEIGSL